MWWPLPVLAVGGVLVGLAIAYLPGKGGPSPGGFKLHGPPAPSQLPGIILAALATLAFGAVLGPEMPLIAVGGGLAVLATKLARRRQVPEQGVKVLASAGSFAAISTLLGSPLTGAFLLMEATGLGGPTLGLVLLPGLLASGVGALIFTGLDNLTRLGTFSLAIPGLPPVSHPYGSEFAWAIVIGGGGGAAGPGPAVAGAGGAAVRAAVDHAGGAAGGRGGRGPGDHLRRGHRETHLRCAVLRESALGPLIKNSAGYTVGALLLLLTCKGLAFSASLGSFRGGPVFPAMFVGAAGGIALSHLPGLPPIAGAAMGIGAMCVVMLKLPLTSVLPPPCCWDRTAWPSCRS